MAKPRGSVEKFYLYLDGVSSRDLTLVLLTREKVVKQKVVTEGTRTEKLLPAIATFVGSRRMAGIIVAQGGGSFSQTRIICTVANALAYGWGIKVVAVPLGHALDQLMKKLPKFAWQKIILPIYSGPGVH